MKKCTTCGVSGKECEKCMTCHSCLDIFLEQLRSVIRQQRLTISQLESELTEAFAPDDDVSRIKKLGAVIGVAHILVGDMAVPQSGEFHESELDGLLINDLRSALKELLV